MAKQVVTENTSGYTLTKFVERTEPPKSGNKYYTRQAGGGYSLCCAGNEAIIGRLWKYTTLPNCVGYACGRFNEISGYTDKNGYWGLNCNAKEFINRAKSLGLQTGTAPQQGAILVWTNAFFGHVAVVEKVYYYKKDGNKVVGKIRLSQSGWSTSNVNGWWAADHYYDSSVSGYNANGDSDWLGGESWMSGRYHFLGFIYNPSIKTTTLDANLLDFGATRASVKATSKDISALAEFNAKAVQERKNIVDASTYRGIDLLTSNNLVESPFIIAKIGDYTFGSYTKVGTLNNKLSGMTVNYPNYMDSITIVKTNGTLNQYTLRMIYQVTAGNDPNLLDKIFSSVGLSGEIVLTYGDWQAPSFIFKEEAAIITKVTSDIDLASQRITYTLECVSKALEAAAAKYSFPAYNMKGSDVIKNILLKNNHYGLLSVFKGMSSTAAINAAGWIASDDKKVSIKAQKDISAIDYLNYVIGCMSSVTNKDSDTIKDSTYHLVIMDDINNEYGGSYFKVVKVGTSKNSASTSDMYEIDVGYPTSTLVTDFKINQNDSWAILYKYSGEFSDDKYKYTINNNGELITEPKSAVSYTTDEIEKTWWTAATKHPITATLTIKGLLRPAILMSYIKINTYFYGKKHISSGIYTITKQQDEISGSGYRTTLSLTRIAGDE